MLQLDPTTQASLEAATTPNARAAAIISSLSGTITVTVRDGSGATKGSGTMTSFGVQSANVIVLNNVTSFTVSETGTPDPATWTIEFANAGGRFVKGTFGLYTSPVAEFKWSLATWENGQSGTIASAYCTVRKNEVLSDAVDTFNVTASPTNQAPYWLPSRPTSLGGSVGSTLQLAQYATDPDGDVLTYSITSFVPPGYSINSSTGALTVGTTTQSLTIRVSDINGLSSDWSVTVTVGAEATASYPRLGAYWIGNNATLGGHLAQYQSATGIALMAKRHLVVINGWPELQASRSGVSNQQIAAAVKAASTKGTEVCVYFDTERVYKNSATTAYATRRAKIAAENWYVYASGTTGTPLNSYFSTDGYAINPTEFVPNDSAGRSAMEWMADYEPSWIFGGAEGNTTAPDIDGVFLDNTLIKPRQNADWDRTGGADGGVGEYDPSSVTQRWYREGIAAGANRYRNTYPTRLNLANLAEFINFTSTPFPQYDQVFDGGVLEHAIGRTFSIETWATTAVFVQRIGWVAASVRDETKVLFNCQPDNNSATNYQAFRHALACCTVVTNFCLDYTRETEYLRYYDDYDEYNFDLGAATTGKQTAATSNGIWRRDFDNGIVLWCPKGVTGTISLGGTFYVLRGNAAAGRTPGSAVTSITFSSARDGLILSRIPT